MENINHLSVSFFTEPVENKARSAKEGALRFDDVEFARIKFVGDGKNELVVPANSRSLYNPETGQHMTYKDRFPKHYAAFKENQTYVGDGTPLKEAGFLSASKVKELALMSIHTVEALAGLDGSGLSRIGMGGRELQTKAAAYIAKTSGNADVMKIASENSALKDQIEALQRQMQEVLEQRPAAPQPVAVVAPAVASENVGASPFADWQDEDIKAFIADRLGARPRGQPSHATLVTMADEIIAKEAEKAA